MDDDSPDFWQQQQLLEEQQYLEERELRFVRATREFCFSLARKSNPFLFDRLMARIDVGTSTACWNWLRATTADGYGFIKVGGRNRRAHRLLAECFYGPLGDLEARHLCHNPACCNPAHIRPGTHHDNMDDRVAAGRGGYLKGSANGRAKLTDALVRYIRSSSLPGPVLAAQLGVSRVTISGVRRRSKWAHVA